MYFVDFQQLRCIHSAPRFVHAWSSVDSGEVRPDQMSDQKE